MLQCQTLTLSDAEKFIDYDCNSEHEQTSKQILTYNSSTTTFSNFNPLSGISHWCCYLWVSNENHQEKDKHYFQFGKTAGGSFELIFLKKLWCCSLGISLLQRNLQIRIIEWATLLVKHTPLIWSQNSSLSTTH